MGPADDRAPSGCFDLVETDRQPEIPQPLQESRVAVGPVQPEPFELRLQWPFAGLDEVGEDVHGPGENAHETSQPGNEPEAEALGAGSGLGHTGETVVVGQRDRCAACGCGELDDSSGVSEPSEHVECRCRSITALSVPEGVPVQANRQWRLLQTELSGSRRRLWALGKL